MSAYSTTQTEFTDADLLISALREMGYQPVDCTSNPAPLKGYQGDYRTMDGQSHTNNPADAMHAHVIIPQKQTGRASNDIGFIRGADGKFTAIYSDFDRQCVTTPAWQQKLAGEYANQKVIREAKKQGLRMASKKTENGKTQYVFVR